MGTKAIFLDIDGVLNCYGVDAATRSKSRCGNYVGIDKDKVQRLSRIVKETDAILILSSSWKVGWEPNGAYDKYSPSNFHAKYLDNHLKKKGGLTITDKTRERNLALRGMGIKAYLMAHPEITNWVVLDDEKFVDYEERDIFPHLILTHPCYGLTDEDAEAAIKMLKDEIKGPYIADPQKHNLPNSLNFNTALDKNAGPANVTES